MSDLAICRRYAAALHGEAEAGDLVDRVDGDIAAVNVVLAESRELELLFASPVVNTAKKQSIIEKLFTDRVSDLFLRFLLLLNEKGRGDLVSDVLAEYRALRNRERGVVEAKAKTAMKLSEEEVDSLRKRLADRTGADVQLEVEQDPELLGGVVVRVGDTVFDGSLRRQLTVLRTQMESGSFLRN